MSKELVIGSNRHETKVAILEDDQLVEIYFQRENEYSLAGSIHKGRVTRVLPGMQSAFVDLGLERDTFLYVSDFFEEHEDIDTVDEKPVRDERRGDRRERRDRGERGERGERPAIASVAPVQEVAAPAESSADVQDAEVPVEAFSTEATDVEQREGDKQDGGNFRRNRRSRRRRSRGRGFPDNKYADPTRVNAEATASPEEELADEGEEQESAADSEVIVLPGESLAKYRQAPPATEEVRERADELALSEKVFAHHADEAEPEQVEEKIDAVKQDEPASSFIVHDLDLEDAAPESYEEAAAEEAHEPAFGEVREPAQVEELQVAAPAAVEDETASVEVADLEDAIDQLEASHPDEEEEAGADEAEDTAETEPEAVATDESGVQTASVREHGGRSMHRVSRRMRRRRNRFGDRNPQNQTPQGGEAPTAAAGAAAAAEPETRVEPRREQNREQGREQEERSSERPERVLPSITELLKPGQEIIVQIAKEPLGQKGARITSHIALPGRYVVFMPSVTHLGVSRKIASDEERQRLKRILQTHRAGTTGGFIVRTAGEGIPEDEIAADMDFLYKLWLDIRRKAEKKPAPALLHYDLDIVQRILRDQVTEEFKAVWVDNEDLYERTLSFLQRFQPALVNRVKMYTRPAPIFDAFGITQELEKALRPKVWLKSGGYIVINQTEALVAIDINTGKYVGKSNRLEDTIAKTNVEAVKEIVRQIRLRDLGGIIVVDFIDMDERKNRQKVMQALEEAMQSDRAPYKILQFNDFGLVAITRKRVKQSLERTLCSPCPYCEGAGYVKSVQTVIGEILVEAQKIAKAIEGKDVLLRVHPEVAKVLKANNNKYLEELEEILRRPVLVKGDPALHQEKFDLG